MKITNLSLELNKVFTSWLQLETPLLDNRKFRWLADEHLEGIKVLVEGAKGHPVAVQVQNQPETTFLPALRQNCVIGRALLHTFYQRSVFRCPKGILPIDGTAHAGVCWNSGEQTGAVDLRTSYLTGDEHVISYTLS